MLMALVHVIDSSQNVPLDSGAFEILLYCCCWVVLWKYTTLLENLWPIFCVQSEIWDGSQMVHHVLWNNISSLGNHCFPFLYSRWSLGFFSFSMQKRVILGFCNCLYWPLPTRAWQCEPMNRSRIPIHRLQSPRQPITSVVWATGNK